MKNIILITLLTICLPLFVSAQDCGFTGTCLREFYSDHSQESNGQIGDADHSIKIYEDGLEIINEFGGREVCAEWYSDGVINHEGNLYEVYYDNEKLVLDLDGEWTIYYID